MAHRDNTEIGKYRIIAQIGEGAMGVVYRATDPVLNRTVAIKVMSDALARDDDLRGRFLREAQAAGSLQHPNVVTIFDCGEVDGHLFIAMEFVEGEDLEDVLRNKRPLTLVDKLEIVIDVLGGLAYAHKRGIVHRDIKPANIRIDEEGRARIMDFGIAHLSSSNMTRTGVMVGTPAYMAPEQIVGGAITPGTDIFSVGAVLFELLTGVKPFHADTLQSVMYKIVSQPAPSLTTHASAQQVPESVNIIVQRALAKDAGDRYQSALEMANALTAVRSSLDRQASISKSVSLRSVIDTGLATERAAKKRDKQRALVIGGSVALAAAVTAAVIITSMHGHGSTQASPPTAAESPPAIAAPATPVSATPASTQPPTTPSPATTVQQAAKPAPAAASAQQSAQSQKSAKTAETTAAHQELALFQSLRNAATESRKRAADAGASADQLQTGDDHTKTADASAAKGKFSDAADHLTQATSAWNSAERDARAAAAAAANTRARAAEPTKTQAAPAPVAPAPVAPAPPPVVAPAPISPPAAAPQQPASNPAVDIRAAVAAYARAIESRDVVEVRRAYPGITSAQASGFEQFFGTLRSLHATFAADGIDVTGNSAEAKLVGEYDYVTSAGKSEKQPVSFQATFRRDGGTWKLMSVR